MCYFLMRLDDVRLYLDRHPGGRIVLAQKLGIDATRDFNNKSLSLPPNKVEDMRPADRDSRDHSHSRLARHTMASMAVGVIKQAASPEEISDTLVPLMTPHKFRECDVKRVLVTPASTVKIFKMRVLFGDAHFPIRLGIGQHVELQYLDKNEHVVVRAYTPISTDNTGGFDIFFKSRNGEMTGHLENCDSIRLALPQGFGQTNPALECATTDNKMFARLGLVAGGTGLTLMLNIIDSYLKLGNVESIVLLNVNSNSDALFGIEILQNYASSAGGRLRFVNLCESTEPASKANYDADIRTGSFCREVLEDMMPEASDESCVIVCGPPGFNSRCRRLLRDELHHPEEGVRIF